MKVFAMRRKCALKMVSLALAAPGIFALSCAARAEQAATNEDDRALAGEQVFAILQNVRADSRGTLNELEARQIADAIRADGKLDALEIDLIDELSASSIRAIRIAPEKGNGEPVILGTQSGPALRVFDELMTEHLTGLFGTDRTAQGWEALVRYSLTSQTAYKRCQNYLAPGALAAAKQSTVPNTYKPIREYVSGLYAHNNQLPQEEPALNDRGRWLIYMSVKLADIDMSDQLPDFLYSWIRPGGSIQ